MQTIAQVTAYDTELVVDLPVGAKFLAVTSNDRLATLHFLADPELATEPRRFVIGVQGDTVSEGLVYLGTFTLNHNNYVGHIFEGKP